MLSDKVTPRLIPFRTWAASHGMPISTAYAVIKRHKIKILKVGRNSCISSHDDARFVAEVLAGRGAIVANQDINLRHCRQPNRGS